ncbi:MAG: geranylgeranyl reductase family protein [Propionibacteriaceae bacterium]|jgi:geranylgeranyl reductase family protein|nr:geranylgeranyl reductase family protein [Propionibacteriaceae bacterium]
MTTTEERTRSDVVVVGAGPGGCATAIHLAKSGLNVTLLEKAEFPRDKICGDGLTPRVLRELAYLGINPETLSWKKNRGLRIHVAKSRYLLEWPESRDFPSIGMAVKRSLFDHFLANQTIKAGVNLVTNANVCKSVEQQGRITGVETKDGRCFEAPIVVACDGGSARLAVSMGLHRIESRPMGIAVRAYFSSPASNQDWLDSWLELWDGTSKSPRLLPGYAWSFPLGDGTCNVGLGLPDAARYRDIDLRDTMSRWLMSLPDSWGFTPDHQLGKIRSAALPMGFNRKPVYSRGLFLVGDAAGAINPFNGEGISYAMESGRFAAEAIIQGYSRGLYTRSCERAFAGYASRLGDEWGGYFWLGNLFGRIISNPHVMKIAAHYGLPIPVVRNLTHRMLSHVVDRPSRDTYDRVVNTLTRMVPQA